MAVNPNIIGRGWAFPFRFTTRGGIEKAGGLSSDDAVSKIRMAIQQILLTKLGSRYIDRDFGSDLRGLVFTPIDSLSAARVRGAIVEAIQNNEKRVDILNVEIDLSRAKEGILEAKVDFRIIATQVEGNLVYPFLLTPDMRVQGQITI